MLTLLKGSYTVMLPFFTRTNWHSDARGYGLLLSAIGMGTLVGMFGLSVLRDLHHKTGVVLGMCLLIGFSLIAVAFSSFYLLGLTMLFLTGLAYAVANALLLTQLQLMTEEVVRGRVMAFRFIALLGISPVGGLLTSSLSQIISGGTALAISALMMMCSTSLLLRPLFATEKTEKDSRGTDLSGP